MKMGWRVLLLGVVTAAIVFVVGGVGFLLLRLLGL